MDGVHGLWGSVTRSPDLPKITTIGKNGHPTPPASLPKVGYHADMHTLLLGQHQLMVGCEIHRVGGQTSTELA